MYAMPSSLSYPNGFIPLRQKALSRYKNGGGLLQK